MKITVELNEDDIRAIYSDFAKFNWFIEIWSEVSIGTKTDIKFIYKKGKENSGNEKVHDNLLD